MSSASNWWSIAPMSGGEHHYDIHHVYRCRGAYVQRRTANSQLTSNAYVRFGISTVGAAASDGHGILDDVIPAGSSVVYTVPPSVTHFRVIADAAGTLVVSKVGN